MIRQLQDQNKRLYAQIAPMNRENNRERTRLAATRTMMTLLEMRRKTIVTILIGERKPFKPLKTHRYILSHSRILSCR